MSLYAMISIRLTDAKRDPSEVDWDSETSQKYQK